MPCMDYFNGVCHNLRRKNDNLARMLCEVLTELDKHPSGKKQIKNHSRKLQQWWKNHKKKDAERSAAERKKKEQEKIAEKAYKKLTPKEREALGIITFRSVRGGSARDAEE